MANERDATHHDGKQDNISTAIHGQEAPGMDASPKPFHARNFEDILYTIKPHSVWQHCVLAACMISLIVLCGLGFGQPIFIIGQMDYECVVYKDGSFPSNFSVLFHLPTNASTTASGSDESHQMIHQAKNLSCTSPRGSPCKSWHYSSPYYASTMVSEWNLVCSRSYLRSVYQSCFLGGYLIGMAILGALSDAFGRTFVIRLCWPLIMLTYIGTTWAPAFWFAACMRTLYGLFNGGNWVANFVLIMEISVPERRNFTSTITGTNFIVTGVWISILGYFITDWRKLQLIGMLIAVASLPFTLFLPESPRWLVTQEKYDRARAVLKRAARWNRSTLLVTSADLKLLHDQHVAGNQEKKVYSPWQRVAVIFASRQLLLKTFIFFVVWFLVANVYYGVTFYGTGVIPGNPYVTFGLMSISRAPFIPVQLYALRRFGPRNVVICWFWISAAFLGALGAFPAGQQTTAQQAICIALVIGANIFIDNCFAAIYILTAEIYPTVNRQTGMSMCSMVGRVGGAVSPFIANSLGEVWRPFPAIIFSTMCIVASLFVCLLPNLKNVILPDSVRDTTAVEVSEPDEVTTGARKNGSGSNTDTVMEMKDLVQEAAAAPRKKHTESST